MAAPGHMSVSNDAVRVGAADEFAEHGVRVVRLPWAEPGGHFHGPVRERLAIDWLLAASQSAVAKRLGLSWDEVHGIMVRRSSVVWRDGKRSRFLTWA